MPVNSQLPSRETAVSATGRMPEDRETIRPQADATTMVKRNSLRPIDLRDPSNLAPFPAETKRDLPSNDVRASRRNHPAYLPLKRAIDVVVGLLLLIPALPIILIAAAVIRLETPGSPFFVQTRLGQNGQPFKIFKLRGMYIDARSRFPSFYDFTGKQNLDFCFHHEIDPRITRAGTFIRKTSIDELPNLWNVVLGDMSLVGPRPEIPEVMALYGAYRDEYLSVKPGVTCVSKCTGRDRLTKRETIEFDLEYIRDRSLGLDLAILSRTFRSVVLRQDVF